MPKDRTENIDRYKVRGGQLNEYELERNEGEFEDARAGTQPQGGEGLRGADEPNAPRRVAERIQQVEQRAHEIVERRRAKQAGGGASKKGGRRSEGHDGVERGREEDWRGGTSGGWRGGRASGRTGVGGGDGRRRAAPARIVGGRRRAGGLKQFYTRSRKATGRTTRAKLSMVVLPVSSFAPWKKSDVS